ncbi:MAG TPA: Holliday junction resolvase RuvX [Microbacteriaceae bacterium]|nr:Holliday junction resolvase RuvX [Microbacteriaceae bacterium]
MRRGVRLGVDVGQARIGLSRSDRDGLFASAVETIARDHDSDTDVRRLVSIASECEAIEWVVGLPIALSGRTTASTEDAVAFAQRLARASGIPVRLVDERLSSVSAHAQLHASGRKTRSHRSVVDQVAAVILLQTALDAERSGRLLGELLEAPDEGAERD